jgi:hypothetical protein
MSRNRLAGTTVGTGKTAVFYHNNESSRAAKQEYDAKYQKKTQKRRAILQAINRKNGTHGNLDHKDVAHVSKTKTISQDQSKNRADKKRIFFRVKKD